MIYFTCDACGEIIPASEPRFKVYVYVELAEEVPEETLGDEEFDPAGDGIEYGFSEDFERMGDATWRPPDEEYEIEDYRMVFDVCEKCKGKYFAEAMFKKLFSVQGTIPPKVGPPKSGAGGSERKFGRHTWN